MFVSTKLYPCFKFFTSNSLLRCFRMKFRKKASLRFKLSRTISRDTSIKSVLNINIEGTRARRKFRHAGTRARGHADIEGTRARRARHLTDSNKFNSHSGCLRSLPKESILVTAPARSKRWIWRAGFTEAFLFVSSNLVPRALCHIWTEIKGLGDEIA